jgi:hypothetical protein
MCITPTAAGASTRIDNQVVRNWDLDQVVENEDGSKDSDNNKNQRILRKFCAVDEQGKGIISRKKAKASEFVQGKRGKRERKRKEKGLTDLILGLWPTEDCHHVTFHKNVMVSLSATKFGTYHRTYSFGLFLLRAVNDCTKQQCGEKEIVLILNDTVH